MAINKPKPAKITMGAINNGKAAENNKTRNFKTRIVDYNELVEVVIDSKTKIYIKKGQDKEEAKQRFLKRLSKSKW
jgi:hypothetical protein